MESKWSTFQLYDLADWRNGLAFRDFQFSESGRPIIKIAELKDGVTGQTKFTQQTFGAEFAVEFGDMLFSWSGNPDTSIDVFWWKRPSGWLNQHIFKVTPKSDVERVFLYYVLRFLKPIFAEIARNKQTTGLGHVTIKDLKAIEVAIPEILEQRAIAAILDSFEQRIALNQRTNEVIEEMAQTLFRSWFVDFDPVKTKTGVGVPGRLDAETTALFPDGFEESEIGRIPEGWRIGSLDGDFNVFMGQSPPGSTYNTIGDGLPFFQGRADFGFRYPSLRVFCTAPTRIAEPGDTLVSVRAPVGDVNMALTRCAIGRGVAAVRHHSGSASYTYYMMQTLREKFDVFNGEGTVFGSISKKDFHGIRILIPPLPVIEKFAEITYPLDEKIKVSTEEIALLIQIRDELLPKLISGEVRVPEDMVAEFAAANV